MQIRYDEEGLDLPLIQKQVEQIKRKEGFGRPRKITDDEVIKLMEACTLNKTQRKKFPQDRICALVVRQAAINSLIIEFKGGNEFHR